ncbi:MAG: hypothetical protein A2268_13355 [Candidatus Raymondbacteria bacterium RifOxyA12_full_50_37]|uniref:DUF2914 domain-containing protein n=1 Tax=Candidatus Raymondbacteria bacterium RIFOXYD12_FULL_49_13 TaxID=1817890 RepID=A0A1F7EZY1_UNCRA|nr:MAG: hypothetical protein A2268_13355 [Candidatus Raymondbacteria bacterium RifOxyA12_full_50_37]OGJ93047.1 MAG: hypothetical protein A2248_18490 [Candidatus Raymondbacteria bacterium RIFOXYA2_FULL_49_16]OGJ94879.1 MAG: hypothetical protein A2350_15540 [Candidatus Raymondbacteria bacterium RifOxyB12_full_50_8]OGJ99959.1 MAG: hypothetical protein A2519_00470 [Candidatus Raymondbacteria bacterium RIFOXYD12_FULL_49_13]OGK04151.1 MAG: hypothetical protein A2487_14150 [Candidatus Raymondbacteria 
MKYSIRNLRILPALVLSLILVLAAMHLFFSPDADPDRVFRQEREAQKLPAMFREFEARIYDPSAADINTLRQTAFEIKPNEKEQTVVCKVSFTLARKDTTQLTFSWFHEDEYVFSETARIHRHEQACSSSIAIPRNRSGAWSVDIVLPDSSIIETISFSVAAKVMPRHFKSLRNKS